MQSPPRIAAVGGIPCNRWRRAEAPAARHFRVADDPPGVDKILVARDSRLIRCRIDDCRRWIGLIPASMLY